MKKTLFLLPFICAAAPALQAQTYTVRGSVTDTAGKPLSYVSVALLNPADSTLSAFGISNSAGSFEIPGAAKGEFLLQAAIMGYFTVYRKVTLPTQAAAGTLVLSENPAALSEVVVSGEKIPISIKGDTVEYNAGSFKVKPNAVVEDLLRQLPGVEVDRNGNIKSRGKDVKKVLVDGKEFFGDDPKMATKNLPADAISKVQTFDKHSDQSEFTGIDDGQRDQTINLQLKNGKKTGYFGDAHIGGGSDGRYEGAVHAYQFRKKTQLAAMGMLNNVNQFGFTMSEYLNFNGGLRNLMNSNGQIILNGSGNLPVDFGQPAAGLINTGAAGLNYSIEPRKNNRFTISYLGNGADKKLDQQTTTNNYSPGLSFRQEKNSNDNSSDRAHRLNARWRNDIDSFRQLRFNGSAEWNGSESDISALTESSRNSELFNRLIGNSRQEGNVLNANADVGFSRRFKSRWQVLNLNASFSYNHSNTRTEWNNRTWYAGNGAETNDRQYQENRNRQLDGNAGISIVRSLGRRLFLEPELRALYSRDALSRRQGLLPEDGHVFDSLSPDFYRQAYAAEPGLSLRRSTLRTQWSIGLFYRNLWMTPVLNSVSGKESVYGYWMPGLSWQRDLGAGKMLNLNYSTEVDLPAASQMLPVLNNANPLQRFRGNESLRPEYKQNISAGYHHFDQFSMSSMFVHLSGSYTRDKVNWARTVHPDLSQDLLIVNTDYEAKLNGRASFSKTLRRLGIIVNSSLSEGYSKTLSPVNGVNNTNTGWTHTLKLNVSNHKKEKWDAEVGGEISISDSRFSINRELNNTYYNYSGFVQLGYRHKQWFVQGSADVTHYTARSFDAAVTVPLLKAEVSRSFLKYDRGMLTLRGYDLLNRNTSVMRTSQLNYLLEQRSNIIGRYIMLRFTYRLAKTGPAAGAVF